MAAERYCSLEGCSRPVLARGLCPMHYTRWRRHGHVAVVLKDSGGYQYGRSLAERFWIKVKKTGGCWIWAAARDRYGYGQFGIAGQVTVAHRVAWLITHGEIPDKQQVLHHCDTPSCVRPDHLFLGTPADNVADMRAKGRAADQRQAALAALDEAGRG